MLTIHMKRATGRDDVSTTACRAARVRASQARRTPTVIHRNALRPSGRRAVWTVASIAAAAVVTFAGPAAASPAASPADHRVNTAATPCGFYKYWVRSSWFAAYNHCGPTTIRIHADVTGGGSTNDFHLCVGPGQTHLGAGGDYLNAYYIGGAGCPKWQRTPHSPH